MRGEDLPAASTAWAMGQVMDGEATPVQVAGFVVALRAKGETPDELGGLIEAMLSHARPLEVPGPAVDTCGTGGDGAHTVNISTMAAVVVAGAGGRVVKHGNRAATSRSGSADLLEALGVVVDLQPEQVAASVAEAGIGFCFAPLFHPALRHAAVTRRELGVPTVFNVLGPLANPARPAAQAVGVADGRLAGVMARVLAGRGTSALVFRGEDGLDELTVTGPSRVWEVRDGDVEECTVVPEELGVNRAPASALAGGDAVANAAVARRVLAGEQGPVRDAVLLNAAAALVALDAVGEAPAAPLAERLRSAVERSAAAVDSGAAAAALERWTAVTQQLAGR
ncbi:anthranilate phosphoribosyltransferase [Motilibacter rhizosphaerae]